MSRIVLVLGDQLTPDLAALRAADKDADLVVMAEVAAEATYVRHHPKKIAFLFAAMRKFAAGLRADGWQVAYAELDDTDNTQSLPAEAQRRAGAHGADEILVTSPGEWRLVAALGEAGPVPVRLLPDDRFLCSTADFAEWAEGRKELRMEWFYRQMRRRTGLLMEGNAPVGGQWNFDRDNRKKAPQDLEFTEPLRFEPDETTTEVLDLVARRFGDHFGAAEPFWFATDREGALAALSHFVKHSLPTFGDYQDAMLRSERFLSHAVLSMYLNAGLLGWREVCEAVEAAWKDGDAPLNAAEGFIRQIIGWREFMRGIYFHEGPDYASRNVLSHLTPLPEFYWTGETDMACIAACVDQTRAEAYAHHIQRLMVTGNFALLAGLAPQEVAAWYLAVYADAYEWVEAPNVIGMSLFADGGIVGSKPYVSSGAYIDRMSDYCKSCAYKVKVKTGPDACPFNVLYWHFLDRHRERFSGNPRMAQMYRTWDRMSDEKRAATLSDASLFLQRLEAGERV